MLSWIAVRSHAARRPLILVASLGAVIVSVLPSSQAARVAVAERVADPAPVVTPAPTPPPRFRPARIEIPAISVSAPIVAVGIDADGAMGTPSNGRDVAWWDGIETGAGNALFAGHRDWNRRPGSFYRLGELKPGDVVRVIGDTAVLEFRVEWLQQVGADAPAAEILGDAGRPVITLITCGGEFDRRVRHYKDRVVVRAGLLTA